MEEILRLFTLPVCPQCKRIHELLDEKNMKYIESQDTAEMIKLGIDHTPSALVNGEILSGKALFNYINEAK